MPTDEPPPAWKLWAGSTLVLVLALIATPSEIDSGDICPRPAGWLVLHRLAERSNDDFGVARRCNDAAPKRVVGAGLAAALGAAITIRSHRRRPEPSDA